MRWQVFASTSPPSPRDSYVRCGTECQIILQPYENKVTCFSKTYSCTMYFWRGYVKIWFGACENWAFFQLGSNLLGAKRRTCVDKKLSRFKRSQLQKYYILKAEGHFHSTRTYLFSLQILVRGSPTAMVVATLLRKSINCLYCLATFVKCWLRHFTTNLVNYITGSSKENFLLQEFHIKKLKNDLKSISWDKLQH